MTILQSITLGLIQGLTEFIPVSSSAHLALVPRIFGWEEHSLNFDIMLHAGTLIALLIFFRNDIIKIVKDKNWKLVGLLTIGSIPAALLGFFLEDQIDSVFKSNGVIITTLIAVGVLMVLAEKYSDKIQDKLTIKKLESKGKASLVPAIIIGTAQALALIRGVSRSGATITAGLFLKMSKEDAARFSFLLSIPIVAGVTFKTFLELGNGGELFTSINIIGLLSATISGTFAIRFLLNYLKTRSLLVFTIYRVFLAMAVLMVFGV